MNTSSPTTTAAYVSPANHGGSTMYSTAYAKMNPQAGLPSSWTNGIDYKAQHDADFAAKQKMIDAQYMKMINNQPKGGGGGGGGGGLGYVRGAGGDLGDLQWRDQQRKWEIEDRNYSLSQRKDKFGLEQQLADAEYLKALAVFLQAGGNVGMLRDNPTAAKFLSGIFKNMQANPSGGSPMVQPWTGSTGIDNKPAGWFTGEYAAQQRGKEAALGRSGAAIDRFMGSKLSNGARVFSTTTSADGSLTGYKAQWDPLPTTNRRMTTAPNGARRWTSPLANQYGYS